MESLTTRAEIEQIFLKKKIAKLKLSLLASQLEIAKDDEVTFIIGRSQDRISVKKSLLLAKSFGFAKICASGSNDVYHPEYDLASFDIFIKFITSDNLCFAESHVCDLLRLAFVYQVPYVTQKCREFAQETLSLENCLKYHLSALLYELEDLQTLAFRFMLRQGHNFLLHPSFLELDPITLGSLIGRDDFLVVETDLFVRLLEWVRAECLRLGYPPEKKEFHRRVCGNLFQHVRFAMMTPKEFFTIVLPYEILCPKDIEAIQLRFLTHPQMWPTLPPTQYKDRPRGYRPPIKVPLHNNISSRRKCVSIIQESFRFLLSQNMYLVGIEFFGPSKNGPLTSYTIKYLIENEFMASYWKSPVETIHVLASENFEVELTHPFKINSQYPYRLTVWFEGEITQYGSNPLPQAVVCLPMERVCIHFSDNITSLWISPNETLPLQPETQGVIKSLLFQTMD